MNISGQEFIQAMSAIGAGIAMIAGVGPGVGQGRSTSITLLRGCT